MSWDVYGQPLRPGHCEVHPDTPAPYPCPRCLDEQQAERDRDYQAQLEYEQLATERYDEPWW